MNHTEKPGVISGVTHSRHVSILFVKPKIPSIKIISLWLNNTLICHFDFNSFEYDLDELFS